MFKCTHFWYVTKTMYVFREINWFFMQFSQAARKTCSIFFWRKLAFWIENQCEQHNFALNEKKVSKIINWQFYLKCKWQNLLRKTLFLLQEWTIDAPIPEIFEYIPGSFHHDIHLIFLYERSCKRLIRKIYHGLHRNLWD